MQFFNPNSKHLMGAKFNCSTCKKEVQEIRGCRINSYELTSKQAKKNQIQIIENGLYHKFCPSKLWRDNPEIVIYFESLFAHYKTGIELEKLDILLDNDVLTDLNYLIMLYEQYIRIEQYKFLLNLLGGTKDNK